MSVLTTTTIACLLGLISIGSSTALNDVLSLTINGLYSSYLICCSLLLWRRCTGAIKPPLQSLNTELEINTASTNLTWGPFRLPGALGIVTNSWACVYMIVVLFFSFWPPATPTTAATMNFSVLVTGTVVLFSVVYYWVWARRVYRGPVMEIGLGGWFFRGFSPGWNNERRSVANFGA